MTESLHHVNKDDTCNDGLSRRSLRVSTYEMSWEVKRLYKKAKKSNIWYDKVRVRY